MKTKLTRTIGAVAVVMCLVAGGAHADDTDARIMEIEKSLWAAWAKADVGTFDKHLTVSTVNMTPGGITVGKSELIQDIGSGSCKVAGYSFGDMKVVHPAENVALLVYSADQDAVCGDAKLAAKIYVTSVYVFEDGEWKAAAYAETPVGS